MIKFECSSCGYSKDVPDKYGGKKVRCPKCNTLNTISNPQTPPIEKPNDLIKIYCSQCNKKIGVPPEYAGRRVKCTGCNNPITVPALAQQTADNDSAGTQDLADMGKQVRTMDLPPELQRPPVPVASEMSVEDGMEGNAGAEIKKPKKGHFLDDWPIVALIGITIIIILTGLFINLILDTVGTVKKRHPAPGEQIKKANEFATRFIGLLAKGDVNNVSAMLIEELRGQDPNESLKPFIETIGSKWNENNYNLTTKFSAQETTGNVYMFGYILRAKEPGNVFVAVSEEPNGLAIAGINYYSGNGRLISLESGKSSQIAKNLGESFVARIVSYLKWALLVVMILFAIARLSKAVVFYRNGESAWAAIVPFWHEWILT